MIINAHLSIGYKRAEVESEIEIPDEEVEYNREEIIQSYIREWMFENIETWYDIIEESK